MEVHMRVFVRNLLFLLVLAPLLGGCFSTVNHTGEGALTGAALCGIGAGLGTGSAAIGGAAAAGCGVIGGFIGSKTPKKEGVEERDIALDAKKLALYEKCQQLLEDNNVELAVRRAEITGDPVEKFTKLSPVGTKCLRFL